MAMMKTVIRRLGLAAAAAGVLVLAAPIAPPALARGPDSVADLAEGLIDSVVNISTSQTVAGSRGVPLPEVPDGSPFQEFFDDFFNRQQQQPDSTPRKVQSLGSGFVIDASGIIITNNHVIEGADEITANFNDGTKLKATVLGHDSKTDLAVLKVEPAKPLKALKFGDSEKLRVGDWVMAIGNPFGLGGTVTVGIVSARNRDINSGPYDNFIQTDAAINRGNSGGPLFNMDGEVIGINTAIISPSGGSIGIGFAVPSSSAINVVAQLREFGETRRGWLGVRIQQVTDEIAESLGLGQARGALVAGVTEDGPAAAAGIQPGDVIVSFAGRPVVQMRDLPRLVADAEIGKAVEVVVVRKGAEVTLKTTPGRLEENDEAAAAASSTPPAEPAKPADLKVLGMTLVDMTPALRTQYGIAQAVNGVVVTAVEPGSSAADNGIEAGNVIVEVAQETVGTLEDVQKPIEARQKEGGKLVPVLVANKDGDFRYVALRLGN
ncbi:DegQ family serine endoprotease [Prosthecomicrobium pneumaticum]|uniref:Probable periplasmic serine endoprotease DegP-like n=1 Tax=Prosthecomicrobium pneumaticum TaxID=81895 RepID=A0A7W9FQM7_9HYPH|nr:DegQ family serine endoprotease [Prosthecomicrobium pneumaticum]MBB5754997.1 serine protease Do [Prosthecomicrobium pneumaticum]